MKGRFVKNLYHNLSNGAVVLLLDIPLFAGYCFSLAEPKPNTGYILLYIMLGLTAAFFLIGFYWIFKMVDIDSKGITISILNKTIQKCSWEEVKNIYKCSYMKNPALKIELTNGRNIYLDDRRCIRVVLKYNCGKEFKTEYDIGGPPPHIKNP